MSDQDDAIKKQLLDHVGPYAKSFCAAILVLGSTLLALGFNVSGPMNRVANAWAESFEIRNDLLLESTERHAIELALASEELKLIDDQNNLLKSRLQELEQLAHEPTN